MDHKAQALIVGVAKHLVTVTVASIGFLVTMMFTAFRDTPFERSAQVSLFSLLLSVLCAILTQMAVVELALGGSPWKGLGPRAMLILSWAFLVLGISAFVVFTWANINLR